MLIIYAHRRVGMFAPKAKFLACSMKIMFHLSTTLFWWGVLVCVNCWIIPWSLQKFIKLVEIYYPPLSKRKALIGFPNCSSIFVLNCLNWIKNITFCHNPTLRRVRGWDSHSRNENLGVCQDSQNFRIRLQGSKHLASMHSLYHWKTIKV
jgi:hypothetical protein